MKARGRNRNKNEPEKAEEVVADGTCAAAAAVDDGWCRREACVIDESCHESIQMLSQSNNQLKFNDTCHFFLVQYLRAESKRYVQSLLQVCVTNEFNCHGTGTEHTYMARRLCFSAAREPNSDRMHRFSRMNQMIFENLFPLGWCVGINGSSGNCAR